MKNLKTGEITPPLSHEEWSKRHAEKVEQEQAARNKKVAKAAPPPDDDSEDLNDLTVAELHERAKAAGIEGQSTMNKAELVAALKK